MAHILKLHPENPQKRALAQAVEALKGGEIIVYPTDACYALGWGMQALRAADEVRALRGLSSRQPFALNCADLAQVGGFATINNRAHRLMRDLTPGPYTFLLSATREVPRKLLDPKRRIIGVRIAASPTVQALLEGLGEPFMTSTLQLENEALPVSELDDLPKRLTDRVAVVLDAGAGGFEPSTVIDCSGDTPELVRVGKGPVEDYLLD